MRPHLATSPVIKSTINLHHGKEGRLYKTLLFSLLSLILVSSVAWTGCDNSRTNTDPGLSAPVSSTSVGQEQKDYYSEMAAYYEAEAEAMRQIADDCREMHAHTSTSPIPGESYEAYYAAYREDLGTLCQDYEELAAKYTQTAEKYRELADQY
jgi:hypothetical protein